MATLWRNDSEGNMMTGNYDASLIQVIPLATSLYALILQIRVRPGMYFATAGISALESFINGYIVACQIKNIDEHEHPPWGDFHEFVRARTGFYESTSGWCAMILSVNDQDQTRALAKFFELFEAFLASADCEAS